MILIWLSLFIQMKAPLERSTHYPGKLIGSILYHHSVSVSFILYYFYTLLYLLGKHFAQLFTNEEYNQAQR